LCKNPFVEKEFIKLWLETDLNLKQLSKKYNKCSKTLSGILKSKGYDLSIKHKKKRNNSFLEKIDQKELRELYNDNTLSMAKIASILSKKVGGKIPTMTLVSHVNKLKWKRKGSRMTSVEKRGQLFERKVEDVYVNQNLTVEQASIKLNLPSHVLYNYINKKDLTKKRQAYALNLPREKLVKLTEDRLTINEIAKHFHCCKSTVRSYLSLYGINYSDRIANSNKERIICQGNSKHVKVPDNHKFGRMKNSIGNIRLARFVMSKSIGRCLESNERVFMKDKSKGCELDNLFIKIIKSKESTNKEYKEKLIKENYKFIRSSVAKKNKINDDNFLDEIMSHLGEVYSEYDVESNEDFVSFAVHRVMWRYLDFKRNTSSLKRRTWEHKKEVDKIIEEIGTNDLSAIRQRLLLDYKDVKVENMIKAWKFNEIKESDIGTEDYDFENESCESEQDNSWDITKNELKEKAHIHFGINSVYYDLLFNYILPKSQGESHKNLKEIAASRGLKESAMYERINDGEIQSFIKESNVLTI